MGCMPSTHPRASAVTADQLCHICRAISSTGTLSISGLTDAHSATGLTKGMYHETTGRAAHKEPVSCISAAGGGWTELGLVMWLPNASV